MSNTGTVVALRRYPVKSMLGEDLKTAVLTSAGLRGDREVAAIDCATGNVATAKHPKLWRGLLGLAARWNAGSPVITLPDGSTVAVDDPAADKTLSGLLGREIRLSRTRPAGAVVGRPDPEDVIADGDDADVPYRTLEIGLGTPGTNFVDYAPVHLVTTATLARVGTEMIRYRPTLVLDLAGSLAFAENDWTDREITIGDTRLLVISPTPRCAVPTLAHGDLPRRTEAVRTLLEHNRIPLPGSGPAPCLGAYAQVLTPGSISLGDQASVA
ncbi:MAG TPA: MOSC N-terminal beta barrel domain-containing protein [Trebonia sp.]|nr:MOSC N-terminal beta barrel domain-containing protein [Trebonia sp.]